MDDRLDWLRIRAAFDAVCELPAEQWPQLLADHTLSAAEHAEVMALLGTEGDAMASAGQRIGSALGQLLAPEVDVGDELGPWRLTAHVASGGMGKVFRAERSDGLYQRTVAIKLLHGYVADGESQRLSHERQVLAGLQLPGVARLYDGGTTRRGHPYLVMEYVEGRPLHVYCEQERPGLQPRLQLFLAMARAVQAAHEHLVVHCDLKPANVLVTAAGEPVLLDFGVAQLLSDTPQVEGAKFGSLPYASPELRAGAAVGVASDVYSLGVMLLELLAAQRLPRDAGANGGHLPVPSQLLEHLPQPLPWGRNLRPELDAICAKACMADPALRYRSVQALADDIERYLRHEPVSACAGGRLYVARKALRRHWQSVAAAIVVVVSATVFTGGVMQAQKRAQEEADIAHQVSTFLVEAFQTTEPGRQAEGASGEVSARQLLDNAASRVAVDLQGAPVQLARMRAVLGLAYQKLGEPQKAERLLQEAAEGLLDPRVGRKEDAAKVLADYSIQKSRGADGAVALQLADQALALLDRDASPEVRAHLLDARGTAMTVLQDFEQAERTYTEAIIFAAQGKGDVLQRLQYNMAMMYWRWSRVHQAERLFRALLLGLRAPDTALSLEVTTRLAQILREQGRFAEALPMLRQSMSSTVRLYGPRSTFVLLQHDALCDLYHESGNYTAAEQQYKERQALSRQLHGEDSFDYSMGLFNYARLQEMKGDLEAAAPLYRQAMEIRQRRLGRSSPVAMRAQIGVGRSLLLQGKWKDARRELEHSLQGLTSLLPKDAPARIEVEQAWAELLLGEGAIAEAGEVLANVSEPATITLQLRQWQLRAQHAAASGELMRALELQDAAVSAAMTAYGPDNPITAHLQVEGAQLAARLGDAQQARERATRAAVVLRHSLVPHAPVLKTLNALLAG